MISDVSLTTGRQSCESRDYGDTYGDSEGEPCGVGERIASPYGWSTYGYGRSTPFFLGARGCRFRHRILRGTGRRELDEGLAERYGIIMAATAWCGTLHLDTEEFDGETFLKQLVEAKRIAYGIGQIERCPTTGRLHFQFYIQAHRTQALSWVRKYIADRAHWEQARGNVQQCIDYCSKDDTRVAGPWTAGMPKRQGQTAGLEAATELVCSGVALAEVARGCRWYGSGTARDWSISGRPSASMRTAASSDLTVPSSGSSGGHRVAARAAMPGALAGGLLEDPLHPVVGRLWHPRYGHPGRLPWRLHAIDRSPAIARWYPLWVEIKGGSLPMLATRYVIVQSASCRLVHQRRPHGTILRRVRDFAEAHGRLLEFPLEQGTVIESPPPFDGWLPID